MKNNWNNEEIYKFGVVRVKWESKWATSLFHIILINWRLVSTNFPVSWSRSWSLCDCSWRTQTPLSKVRNLTGKPSGCICWHDCRKSSGDSRSRPRARFTRQYASLNAIIPPISYNRKNQRFHNHRIIWKKETNSINIYNWINLPTFNVFSNEQRIIRFWRLYYPRKIEQKCNNSRYNRLELEFCF